MFHLRKKFKDISELIDTNERSFEYVEEKLRNLSIRLSFGGKSFVEMNNNCTTDGLKYRKLAFIIPFRNRFFYLFFFSPKY